MTSNRRIYRFWLVSFQAVCSCASQNNSSLPSCHALSSPRTRKPQWGNPSGTYSPRWHRAMALVSPLCGLMRLCASSRLKEADTMPGIWRNRDMVCGHLLQLSCIVMPQAINGNVFQLLACVTKFLSK